MADCGIMMKLYIKAGCPWCDMAEDWLAKNGHVYEAINVLTSAEDYATMRRLSGQSLTPVLVLENGRLLADFGPEELPGFFA
jgi:glutaredoxin 3